MTNFKAAKPASSSVRGSQRQSFHQTPRFTPSLLVLALSSALALPGAALAADWGGTVSNDWSVGGNWNTAPANNDVDIDTTSPNSTLLNTGGAGSVIKVLRVGVTAGNTGVLDIAAGGALDSVRGEIASVFGSTGTVTVDGNGASWQNNNGDLSVGLGGTGTLNIRNLGVVNNHNGLIGAAAGSTGAATVNGASWINSGLLIVGDGGNGTLDISNAGAVNNVDGVVGSQAGVTGAVTVDGTTSTWDNSGTLTIGRSGTGTVSITKGGTVVNDGVAVLGEQASGKGTVTVDGLNGGATWTNKSDLFVGFDGKGDLTVSNGGTVSSVTGLIGAGSGSGTVTVKDAGSTWTSTGGVIVGNFGSGNLAISNGGKVHGLVGSVAANAGSNGIVTVGGVNSTWQNDSMLYVGDGGTGSLLINADGAVSNTLGIVGRLAGSKGTVSVNGQNAVWTNSSDLYVGNAGSGDMSILGGGVVHSVSGYIANAANLVSSSVIVDGNGSFWDNSGTLTVGVSGTGSLMIRNGGVVGNQQGYIDGNGSVVTVGSAGTWNNALDLRVGWGGTGTLDVQQDGTVNNATGWIGDKAIGTGTVNVGGANAVWNNSGNLYVGNDGTGNLNISSGGTVKSAAGVLGFAGTGTGTATVDGNGASWLYSQELYVGYGGTGTLTVSNGGLAGIAGLYVSIASLAGSNGTLNIGGAVGAAPTGPGTLQASAVNFGAGTGTLNFNHTDTSGNYDFNSILTGNGTINQNAGWTNMGVDSSAFTGPVNVNGGRLAVNGSLIGASATNVNNGGTLSGTGFVGNTFVNAGGMVAPGNTVGAVHTKGTLHGNNSFTFAAGSIYQVEVDAAGNTDKLSTFGTVTLNGGEVRVVTANGGSYAAATPYTIVSAGSGVIGTFATVTSDTIFLDPSLSYADPYKVDLILTRNSTPMGSVGQTPGQTSTGTGVQSLGAGAVYNAVLGLSASQARNAFQQLSGEVHASARSVQMQDSHFTRDASLERLRTLDSEVIANDGGADPEEGKSSARLLPSVRDLAYWARAMGSWGHLDGSDGAATVNRDTAGFLMGADTRFGEEGRFGLTGGYSRSAFDVTDRSSSGSSENYHLGAYAGNRWGDLALRTGISYSWHDVSTSRAVAFPGFTDSLKADYKASTTQAFAELGYRIKTERAELEPFAGLAHVNVSSDGFTERGGPAALTSAGNSNGVTFSTVGLRASTKVGMSGGADVTARGSVAWRHAFGDTAPTSTVAFAGGSPFAITGAPVARNVAAVEAGLDFKLTNAATLGVSYSGQFGSGLKDHGARVNFNVAF